jgi:hypothetical protein
VYYNKDTRKGKESIAMKTVRELIDEAKVKHLDVCIETKEGAYEEVFGGGWAAVGEYYWMKEEQFFDGCSVLRVEILDEGIMIITVDY